MNRVTGLIRRGRGVIIEPYISAALESKIVRESRLHLLGYAVIAGVSFALESWAAVTFWLLPMVLTKPVHQLQNTIEHLGLSHEPDILNNTVRLAPISSCAGCAGRCPTTLHITATRQSRSGS